VQKRHLFLAVLAGTAVQAQTTTTPIKNLVVIFQENVSFDHYFATYPIAANPPGEPVFMAKPSTPSVNGLSGGLLTNNPNSAAPFRLSRAQAVTCDQDHDYTHEQQAMNSGLMNKFVEFRSVARATCDSGLGSKLVMGYYDGNTVTALWNYAQNFAMSDNFYGTGFGPSTPGALNLIAGQTHGATVVRNVGAAARQIVAGTVIADARPALDDCVTGSDSTVTMAGKNVGDLLNEKGITWGWFQGGFADCTARHGNIAGTMSNDYVPHHQPFQYYASTANPRHLPQASVGNVGKTDQANHQYDLNDFWRAAKAGALPAVSFLKAPSYQDGHASSSDPLDEQFFLVYTLNALQNLPEWKNMAVIITYDDSDGWYDHVMPPIMSQSKTEFDALTGPGACGQPAEGQYSGRCGFGPRLPLLLISPWSKVNFVDHTVTDQSSVLRFIEDNWGLGRIGDHSMDEHAGSLLNLFDFRDEAPRAGLLFLDPATGLRQ
jgi:phospholipase C